VFPDRTRTPTWASSDATCPSSGATSTAATTLWSVHGTTFRPLTDEQPEPLDLRSQIWIREHAQAPWLVDGLITPDVDGRWLSKRDPEHVADLAEVTWLDGDGVRYLDPEIVLLFKAVGDRRKDRRDLEVAWPRLDQEKQEWLARSLARLYPDHPWREALRVGELVRWPEQDEGRREDVQPGSPYAVPWEAR